MNRPDQLTPERYVDEHRDRLLNLIRHGDPFIRTLALATLVQGGGEGDIQVARQKLDLLAELDPEERAKVMEADV